MDFLIQNRENSNGKIDFGNVMIQFQRNRAKGSFGVFKNSPHSLSKILIFMKERTLLILQGKHGDQLLINQSDLLKMRPLNWKRFISLAPASTNNTRANKKFLSVQDSQKFNFSSTDRIHAVPT